jgi:hypothetical protein
MSQATQRELFLEGITEADRDTLRAWLAPRGWQTRAQLIRGLGWSERKVRMVAETMGVGIVRGQKGFKLTELLGEADFQTSVNAAAIRIAQGKKDFHYGLKLLRRLHEKFPAMFHK